MFIWGFSKDYRKVFSEDYLKIIRRLSTDYWRIIEKIIEKGGGVGWKNYPLFGTDILPPEVDPGLGPPIFFVWTIYT